MDQSQPPHSPMTQTLVASEEHFRMLVEGVYDYSLFMLDTEGNIGTWNPGAQRILGYRADEIIGKHFSIFYPREDVRSGKPPWELDIARTRLFAVSGSVW